MIVIKNYNSVGSMNLDNRYSLESLGDFNVNPDMTLLDFIAIWLTAFKQNSIKVSSYDRLITSKTALENYSIASMPIGKIYINLYGDGFDAMYNALVKS